MSEVDIKKILEDHQKWVKGEGGSRANLSEVDLRGYDLNGANLSGADLYEANLNGVDLSNANLHGADFRGADLRGANLRGAKLIGANLSGANLRETNLSHADLFGANLSEVTGLWDSIKYIEENFETITDGIIAYKTFGEYYDSPAHWEIKEGSVITEHVNPNRTEECGCGINVATLGWVKRNCKKGNDIWKVLIEWKWLVGVVVPYHTNGKIRCERVRLLERVSL
jgi:hypothetical protein